MRKEAEKIELELEEQKKQKTDLNDKIKTLADGTPEKEKTTSQISDLASQITNRETDLARINKSIENAHGSMVSGSASAIVSVPSTLNERSDAHIQTVAQIVASIVTNILDTDDTGQLCWAYLSEKEKSKLDQEVRQACLDYVNANTNIRVQAAQLQASKAQVLLDELKTYKSTEIKSGQKEALTTQIDKTIDELKKGGGMGIPLCQNSCRVAQMNS